MKGVDDDDYAALADSFPLVLVIVSHIIIGRFLSWLGSRIFTFTMMREVSLETLPNVNIRDSSHDKIFNLPIMYSVTGSINQNVFKYHISFN